MKLYIYAMLMFPTVDLNAGLFLIDLERSAFQYKSTMYSSIKS